MDLRFDKVVRSLAPGVRRVYSLILTDAGLYLIYTGRVGALKHYQRGTAPNAIAPVQPDAASVRELQAREDQIALTPLAELAKVKDNYFIRLEALEDIEIRSGKREPEVWLVVTGSEHHLFFPFATLEEVQALPRSLSRWLTPR